MKDEHEDLIAERGKIYGDPKESHEAIATLWSGWLQSRYGVALPLDAEDAAMMLHLMKCARIGRALQQETAYQDNWNDGEVYWNFAKQFEQQ